MAAMKKSVILAMFLLCPLATAEPIGPFVFRVCFTKVRSEFTIESMPVIAKSLASMCVTVVPCDQADFDILEVTPSRMTHYLSTNKELCK